jgi:plasmid stability protein
LATTILQVRDIPEEVMAKLRDRAESQGISLSAYVRGLLAEDAAQETMEEVLARIATREPVELTDEDIITAIHEGRR